MRHGLRIKVHRTWWVHWTSTSVAWTLDIGPFGVMWVRKRWRP